MVRLPLIWAYQHGPRDIQSRYLARVGSYQHERCQPLIVSSHHLGGALLTRRKIPIGKLRLVLLRWESGGHPLLWTGLPSSDMVSCSSPLAR